MDMVSDIHRNSLDDDIRRFVPDEVFETLEEAQETVEFIMSQYGSKEGPLIYALITKKANKNIGYVQLVPIDDGKWEIGYHVAKPYTGNGFATEAVKAFLPVISEYVGITEVYGIRLLEELRHKGVETHLILSDWGRKTIACETDYTHSGTAFPLRLLYSLSH